MMTCPRCNAETITRTLDPLGSGYYATTVCEVCERQSWALTADSGDAVHAAEVLFFGEGGLHG